MHQVRRQPIVDAQLAAAVLHPVDQQAHLRTGDQGLCIVGCGSVERLDDDDALALDRERYSAGHHDGELRATRQHGVGERRDAVDDDLAAVENKQHAAEWSEVVGQRRRRVVGAEWHAHLEGDRRGDQCVLGNRRQ